MPASGESLHFKSTKITITNLPIETIQILKMNENCYRKEIWDIDQCIFRETYNEEEIKIIIKELCIECINKNYDLYGTLLLDYIYEIVPIVNIDIVNLSLIRNSKDSMNKSICNYMCKLFRKK